MRYPDSSSKSRRLFERAAAVMPGGNTRHTVRFHPYPIYAAQGRGARIWDVDGAERLDFVNNYSSLIHGHLHPETVDAVREQLGRLTAVGLPTEAEIILAELICARYPAVEKVRFLNSGTEAVLLAIKIARAHTGKSKIAKIEGAYHGLYDFAEISQRPTPATWGSATAPNSVPMSAGTPAGVLENVVVLPLNDIEVARAILERHESELAGVLVDVMPAHLSFIKATPDFLQFIRDFTWRSKALFILDEVYSLRLGHRGAHGHLGLKPDLVAMGKIIGGGFPIGAVGGSSAVMKVFEQGDSPNFLPHGGTYNANPISMVAGAATLTAFDEACVKRLNHLGDMLRSALREQIASSGLEAAVLGDGSVLCIRMADDAPKNFRDLALSRSAQRRLYSFFQCMLNTGIYMAPQGIAVLSSAMSESDIDRFADCAKTAFSSMVRTTA